ncbi:neural-cadherin-like [Limulus polyphemus]|uniref:Neural-cadherin-like n=1 Tax=Limulus polyphemus TaxID=6850 RepID=A0ABM1SRN9_LIMPO|nr:neural-cadherin-like [Limulus polyphemus]
MAVSCFFLLCTVTKYIRIGIGDKNDNPPYFDQALYEAEVNEDEDIQHTVITVTAKDKDEFSVLEDRLTTLEVFLDLSRSDAEMTNLVESLVESILGESSILVCVNAITFFFYTHLQVTATDGDRDRPQDIVYFLTGQGTDEIDPAQHKFAINSSSGEIYALKPLDRDRPRGRSYWRFTVFAEDEGGHGLVGYADVLVNLKDINDNPPFFPSALYIGNVTEDGPAGMTVMTMTATDYDDAEEGENAKLTYSIEQNPVNERGELIFTIDKDTGVISTAVCCLDRETNPEYTIKVVATDGGRLSGTGTATIKVKDINDMPPRFTKNVWNVEVDETDGGDIPHESILVVSVNDKDLLDTNRFSYEVLQSAYGSDKFTMLTNPDGTGSLKITKPLDYEDPNQRFGFNITIQVSDDGGQSKDPRHIDRAKIEVRIRDINDNPPKFLKENKNALIPEDAEIETSVANFTAVDPEKGGSSKVSYVIERRSDKKRQFKINQKGEIKVQRKLDREDIPQYKIKVLAIDDGNPTLTATATLTVTVDDVNDNAPRFLEDYRPVFYENKPPKQEVQIQATDEDDRSKDNGPPFTFRMDFNAPPKIKEFFEVEHDGTGADGAGMAIVRSKVEFDREEQKEYHVPIVIKDSGRISMTGTSTLTVVIGDVNDNLMRSDKKNIFVYTYKGDASNISIGRVHVNDLDDWDLPDKVFAWDNNVPDSNFNLDPKTGNLSMKNVTPGGPYSLAFNVFDRRHTKSVSATVHVRVQEIPEEAIYSSGSVRILGTSAEDFVRVSEWKNEETRKSKFDKFRDALARVLKIGQENIDIFTVYLKQERPPVTDVRFAAHGSTYYKASILNGAVDLNRKLIEQLVDINIVMVGIDECIYEKVNCEGSCTNKLMVESHPVVVNANKTSFVGINSWVKPQCKCGAREFSEPETCKKYPPTCLNGGRCNIAGNGIKCTCTEGFTGPQCQQPARFFNGNGWAWFPPLQQCEKSHFSIEFMTKIGNGLLLYNGPISDPDYEEEGVQDFISLELRNGKPRLLIDFGSGTAEVLVDTQESLSDGAWHKVDIFWDRENARMMVDNCVYSQHTSTDPSISDRSKCEGKGIIPPFNEFLNVNGPLQLGGVHHKLLSFKWKFQHTREGFDGCIRNVIHNSEVYDLASPGSSSGSHSGCPPSEKICFDNGITSNCKNGYCEASYQKALCVCYPGWHGSRCDKSTQTKMFKKNSYIKYALSFTPDAFKTDIQLQFRTRQKHGELFRAGSKHGREYFVLEVRDEKLRLRFNLNPYRTTDEKELWLPDVSVSDGQWHSVRVLRYGSTASIILDGGGGRRLNELIDYEEQHQEMEIEKQNVVTGGDVQYVGPGVTLVDSDFQEGCLNDIRLDEKFLPMENGSENAAVIEWNNIIPGCPSNYPCKGVDCPLPFICRDMWLIHECSCPDGFMKTPDGLNCTDADECFINPCFNGGTCIDLPDGRGFYCICLDGYSGIDCQTLVEANTIKLSMGALAVILSCLLFILVLVLFIVVYTRNHKKKEKEVDSYATDDPLGNVVTYADEGGGEEDMMNFNKELLKVPVNPDIASQEIPLLTTSRMVHPTEDDKHRLVAPVSLRYDLRCPSDKEDLLNKFKEVDSDTNTLPKDDIRNYTYEGSGSSAGSLSSLSSTSEDNEQDFDYLPDWGPRFSKLAAMYRQGGSDEE